MYLEMLDEIASPGSKNPPEWLRAIARVARLRVPTAESLQTDFFLDRAFFVASFTTSFDSLSHWRGYSSSASRYCIGFDFDELRELSANADVEFGTVDYDNGKLKATMRAEFTKRAEEMWSNHENGNHAGKPENWHPPILDYMNRELMVTGAPFVKHASFFEESEYRLSLRLRDVQRLSGDQALRFRPGNSFVIPYYAMSLTPTSFPIRSITTGPSPFPQEALLALQLLIEHTWRPGPTEPSLFPPTGMKLGISSVPYRDWQ